MNNITFPTVYIQGFLHSRNINEHLNSEKVNLMFTKSDNGNYRYTIMLVIGFRVETHFCIFLYF